MRKGDSSVRKISNGNIDFVFVNPHRAAEGSINSSVALGSEIGSYDLVLIFQYSMKGYRPKSIGGLLEIEFPEVKQGSINLTKIKYLYEGPLALFRKISVPSETGHLPGWVCLPVNEIPERPGMVLLNLGKIIRSTFKEDLLGGARGYSNDEAINRIYEATKKAVSDLSKTKFSNHECAIATGGSGNKLGDLSFKISPSGVDFLIPGRSYGEGVLTDRRTGKSIGPESIDDFINDLHNSLSQAEIEGLSRVSVNVLPMALELEISAMGGKGPRNPTLPTGNIRVTLEPMDNGGRVRKSKTSVVAVPYNYITKYYGEVAFGLDVIFVHAIAGIEDLISRIDLEIKERDADLERVAGWGKGKIWDFVERELPGWAKSYKSWSANKGAKTACKTSKGTIPISLTRGKDQSSGNSGYSFSVHLAKKEGEKRNKENISVEYQPLSMIRADHKGITVLSGKDILDERALRVIAPVGEGIEGSIAIPSESTPTYALKIVDENRYKFLFFSSYLTVPLSGLVLEVSNEIIKEHPPWCIGNRLLLGTRTGSEDTRTKKHVQEGLARIAMAIYVMSEYLEKPNRECRNLINAENKERENNTYGDFLTRLFEYLLSKEHGYILKTLGERVSVFTGRIMYIERKPTPTSTKYEKRGGGCYLDLYIPIGKAGEWEISIATRYPLPIEME